MGMIKTGAMYKALTFDGIDSRDYGVYISGSGVFNAPERDVNMIEIPGRNGAYALDNGRFFNTEVTYPAGIVGETAADFADGIRALRNALCSRKGYCRLEDEYNPNEYRMAVYKSGLDIEPAHLRGGEFAITFECMPQRFLKSGETAVTLASGGTINNPTLYDAAPLLAVKGYGTIEVGGKEIEIHNDPYGRVTLAAAVETNGPLQFDAGALALMAAGDTITLNASSFRLNISGATINSVAATVSGGLTGSASGTNSLKVSLDPVDFVNGTGAVKSFAVGMAVNYTKGGVAKTYTGTASFTLTYSAAGSVQFAMTGVSPSSADLSFSVPKGVYNYGDVSGMSTKTPASGTIFIDLDLGAAYTDGGSGLTSVDNIVDLPAELPVLAPGPNVITYDGTVSLFEITPRWWEV